MVPTYGCFQRWKETYNHKKKQKKFLISRHIWDDPPKASKWDVGKLITLLLLSICVWPVAYLWIQERNTGHSGSLVRFSSQFVIQTRGGLSPAAVDGNCWKRYLKKMLYDTLWKMNVICFITAVKFWDALSYLLKNIGQCQLIWEIFLIYWQLTASLVFRHLILMNFIVGTFTAVF